jgi:hypothetical protein
LIYKCGGIDKRTIEKFEKASSLFSYFSFFFEFLLVGSLGGARFCPALVITPKISIAQTIDIFATPRDLTNNSLGSCRDGQGFLQIRMGARQAKG